MLYINTPPKPKLSVVSYFKNLCKIEYKQLFLSCKFDYSNYTQLFVNINKTLIMKKIAMIIISILSIVCFYSEAQVNRAITVIHCDPDDPNPNDNIPWPQDVSPLTWNKLSQMVQYADSKNVDLTIQLTGDWVNFILASQERIDTLHAWQARGHEIAAHHHLFLHTYWDGYSNIPGQLIGQNGAVLIDSTEAFYNQLRVLCSPAQLLTAGVGPAGSPKDTVAMEWSDGIIYQTTNKSGLNPDNNGGRFTDEAFSDVTHDTLFDPLRNKYFEVCKLSYCFLENIDSVKTIMKKVDTASFNVVGGVIHPFNFAQDPIPFQAWIDSISNRFSGQCKTVSTVIQESDCNNLLNSVYNQPALSDYSFLTVYPNTMSEQIFIKIKSDYYQKTDVSIYNLKGKKIKILYSNYMPKGNFILQSSVSSLSNGAYLIVVAGEKSYRSIKFVKE